MTFEVWIIIVLGAALVGAALAAWMTHRKLSSRYAQRLNRTMQAYQQQHGATMDKLRAAHTKARLELEQQRAVMQRQVAAAVAEQRTQTTRLEERLKSAYAELDRLRDQAAPLSAKPAPEGSRGFASTLPFESDL